MFTARSIASLSLVIVFCRVLEEEGEEAEGEGEEDEEEEEGGRTFCFILFPAEKRK